MQLVVDERIRMELSEDDTGTKMPKYSGGWGWNLSDCHFVYHKSRVEWSGTPGPCPKQWDAGVQAPDS